MPVYVVAERGVHALQHFARAFDARPVVHGQELFPGVPLLQHDEGHIDEHQGAVAQQGGKGVEHEGEHPPHVHAKQVGV
jgi:hypothetical protein